MCVNASQSVYSGPNEFTLYPSTCARGCSHLLMCDHNPGSFYACAHLFTLPIPVHFFTLAQVFTLSAPAHSCLYLSISVHTCPYLPTHTLFCKHPRSLPVFTPTHLGSPCLPVHASMHTYLWSDPGQGEPGCSAAEGAPHRGPRPALEVLPATPAAAHGVCPGAGRGGWSDRQWHCGWGRTRVLASPCFRGTCLGSSALESQSPGPPLLPSVLVQEDVSSPLAVLEELTLGDCRQDLATKLVKLYFGQGLTGPFLDYLTRRELARTSELPP